MATCLIVDDSKVVRKLASRIIEAIGGYSIMEAEHGREAVTVCEWGMPDLILLDWHMPEMNGLEFIKHLRTMPGGDKPKVIFCTTETEFSNIALAIESGANEYVMKPFDEQIIRGKLEQIGLLPSSGNG